MSVATLAGVPKHGAPHMLGSTQLSIVLWLSSLASGLAVWWAQKATVAAGDGRRRTVLEVVVALQLLAYIGANIALGPRMSVLVVNTAIGLLPVTYAHMAVARRGNRSGAWIARGLCVSMLTGVVYAAQLSLGPWLTHVDISHALMGVTYYMILRGASSPSASTILATRRGAVYL
jgi:hypothetical protein